MPPLITNIGEMVEWAYNQQHYVPFLKGYFAKTGNVAGHSGAINPTYGAVVYDHVNREANGHAIFKKEMWERSGFRVLTTNPPTKGYGGADPGSIGAVVDLSPDELSTIPGFLHTPFDLTLDAGFRSQHDDGLDLWSWKKAAERDVHVQLLNEELLKNAESESVTLDTNNTTDAKNDANGTGKGMETIDRLYSSDAEEDAIAAVGTGHFDVYEGAIDRDSATTYDAHVIRPDGSKLTFGTDLPFQTKALDKAINFTEDDGGVASAQVWLTGRDTRQAVYDELKAHGRFDLSQVQAKLDYQGLSQTALHPGRDISYTTRAYQMRPFVVDKNVAVDGIDRIYLPDMRNIHIRVGFPTLYVEVDNPVIRQKFDTQAIFLTCEQIYVTRFNTSAKIRSISA